jgi:hypothetical protein
VTLYVALAATMLFAIGMSVLLAVALGRAAAHEDDLLEGEARRLLAQSPTTHSLPRPRSAGPPPNRPPPKRPQAPRLAKFR